MASVFAEDTPGEQPARSPWVASADPVEDKTFGQGSMREEQLDLFSATGMPPERQPRSDFRPHELVAADLDDGALIAAIPRAGLAEAPTLAAEAGRRRLVAAVPALEQLCLRFAGFGLERMVPEQVASLQGLALIGGSEAAQTVARLIARAVVQGPTRKVALKAAAQLESALSVETVVALLHDIDPEVRAEACRCARPWPAVLQVLLGLADDGDSDVRVAAACALGRRGRSEARQTLVRLLRDAPSVEVIDHSPDRSSPPGRFGETNRLRRNTEAARRRPLALTSGRTVGYHA
jgi:hypothetical protein